MVCGESNKITGEKFVVYSNAEKKNCVLLIRSEKKCTFKLRVKKSIIMKKKHAPPRTKWSAPNRNTVGLKLV